MAADHLSSSLFDMLPDEIVLHIFKFLGSEFKAGIYRILRLVSKRFKLLSEDDSMWKMPMYTYGDRRSRGLSNFEITMGRAVCKDFSEDNQFSFVYRELRGNTFMRVFKRYQEMGKIKTKMVEFKINVKITRNAVTRKKYISRTIREYKINGYYGDRDLLHNELFTYFPPDVLRDIFAECEIRFSIKITRKIMSWNDRLETFMDYDFHLSINYCYAKDGLWSVKSMDLTPLDTSGSWSMYQIESTFSGYAPVNCIILDSPFLNIMLIARDDTRVMYFYRNMRDPCPCLMDIKRIVSRKIFSGKMSRGGYAKWNEDGEYFTTQQANTKITKIPDGWLEHLPPIKRLEFVFVEPQFGGPIIRDRRPRRGP